MTAHRKRVVLFSRYNMADQYDLAAEFRQMVEELASRNDVMHMSLKGPRSPDHVPEGVKVEELPLTIDRASPGNILVRSMMMYLLLPQAALKIRRFKPDVIFLTEILPMMGLFLKWTCRTQVATAYGDWHLHNMLGRKAWGKPLLWLAEVMERFEGRRLSGFFCRATSAGIRLSSWGVKPEGIRVVHDAPNPEEFFPQDQSALRERCGFKPDDIVLLYHGVMHRGKGLDLLLTWTAELYRENPKFGIIMVGGGPEEARLRELAGSLGLGDRAYFTGWLETVKEVGTYCNAADICIAMRTADEANDKVVPGALLHSMACRKIVLGPRLRGIAEILRDGENGYMFEPDKGDDFKALIAKLIDNREDWSRVQENAYRDIADNYSVPAAARAYAAAIEHFASL